MRCLTLLSLMAFACLTAGAATPTFRVATYNLENYLDKPAGTRPVKSPEARAKIRENIIALKPDVIALQEISGTNALLELQGSLKADGFDLPHWELVTGSDTNIHVAVLSRFPITARRPHTNESYLLYGRRYFVSRGFTEVDIKVNDRYQFTLLSCHLKSRRTVVEGDEEEMREQEALILRERIDAVLKAKPTANLVVLGDFNDVKDSRAVRAVLGRANTKVGLVDTRPAERNGDSTPGRTTKLAQPNITWTYFYGKEDTYSRIDYILLSQPMAREWVKEESYILAVPNWGLASDHRPIMATFIAEDK